MLMIRTGKPVRKKLFSFDKAKRISKSVCLKNHDKKLMTGMQNCSVFLKNHRAG